MFQILDINPHLIQGPTKTFLPLNMQTINPQQIRQRLQYPTIHLIKQHLELILFMICYFLHHYLTYLCTLVPIYLDSSKHFILTLLCEFIVVTKHLIELLLALLHWWIVSHLLVAILFYEDYYCLGFLLVCILYFVYQSEHLLTRFVINLISCTFTGFSL